jgi:hypothetical protein
LSQQVHVPFDNRGGIVGFEILPILSTDFHNGEPLYNVFEITGAAQSTPSKFCSSLTYLSPHISSTPIDKKNKVAFSSNMGLLFYKPSDTAIYFPYEAATIEFDPAFVFTKPPCETLFSYTFRTCAVHIGLV